MNIKTLLHYEKQEGKPARISLSDKFFATLSEILSGKKQKYMGDLAKSFGFFFRKMNLEKTDPIIVTCYLMTRNITLRTSPENIKSLIQSRARLNHFLVQHRSEEAIVFNLLFEACYKIIFKTSSKEEIVKRSQQFSMFMEEILLHIFIR